MTTRFDGGYRVSARVCAHVGVSVAVAVAVAGVEGRVGLAASSSRLRRRLSVARTHPGLAGAHAVADAEVVQVLRQKLLDLPMVTPPVPPQGSLEAWNSSVPVSVRAAAWLLGPSSTFAVALAESAVADTIR